MLSPPTKLQTTVSSLIQNKTIYYAIHRTDKGSKGTRPDQKGLDSWGKTYATFAPLRMRIILFPTSGEKKEYFSSNPFNFKRRTKVILIMMSVRSRGVNLAETYKPTFEWSKIDPGAGKLYGVIFLGYRADTKPHLSCVIYV